MDNSNPQNTQDEQAAPESSKPRNNVENLLRLKDEFREKAKLAGIDQDSLLEQSAQVKNPAAVELLERLKGEAEMSMATPLYQSIVRDANTAAEFHLDSLKPNTALIETVNKAFGKNASAINNMSLKFAKEFEMPLTNRFAESVLENHAAQMADLSKVLTSSVLHDIQFTGVAERLAEMAAGLVKPLQILEESNRAAWSAISPTIADVGAKLKGITAITEGLYAQNLAATITGAASWMAKVDWHVPPEIAFGGAVSRASGGGYDVFIPGIPVEHLQPPRTLTGLAADVINEVTACIDLWHRRPQFVAQLQLCYFDAEARGQDLIEIHADDELIALVLIENNDGHLHGVGQWWIYGDSPRFLNSLATWLENKLGIKSALIRDNQILDAVQALISTQSQEVAQEPGALVHSPSKKPRRRGPTPTSEQQIEAHIEGWIKAMGSIKQRDYCKQRGIGVSTLRWWMSKRNGCRSEIVRRN